MNNSYPPVYQVSYDNANFAGQNLFSAPSDISPKYEIRKTLIHVSLKLKKMDDTVEVVRARAKCVELQYAFHTDHKPFYSFSKRLKSWLVLVTHFLIRPNLWHMCLAAAWRYRRNDWWRKFPFLPVFDPKYLQYRMLAMYCDPKAVPLPKDLVEFLRWQHSYFKGGGR